MLVYEEERNGLPVFVLKNPALTLTVCPALGGKIVSMMLGPKQKELLWNNPNLTLKALHPGDSYDPNFFGGIDELLPNDEAETIDGVSYPDHGELWTMGLEARVEDGALCLRGRLQTGFDYERRISMHDALGEVYMDYRIRNLKDVPNPFLFKMHAALDIAPGDRIICPAAKGEIGDEGFTNRFGRKFFDWPKWGEDQLDVVSPAESKKCEFFFLKDLAEGFMAMESAANNTYFRYEFDRNVFPYAWYFATYGGWNGLYTGVLEPATAIPHTLSQSIKNKTCAVLAPGAELVTRVVIKAGNLS